MEASLTYQDVANRAVEEICSNAVAYGTFWKRAWRHIDKMITVTVCCCLTLLLSFRCTLEAGLVAGCCFRVFWENVGLSDCILLVLRPVVRWYWIRRRGGLRLLRLCFCCAGGGTTFWWTIVPNVWLVRLLLAAAQVPAKWVFPIELSGHDMLGLSEILLG